MAKVQEGVWVPKAYVVLLKGDVVAAAVLSQIDYWYQPSANGKSKLRVCRKGRWWIAKSAADWHAELGITQKQAYRSITDLTSRGLIETKVMMFNGHPTKHVRLTEHGHKVLLSGKQPTDLSAEADPFSLVGNSLTESTAETTTEKDPASKLAKAHTEELGKNKSSEEDKGKDKVVEEGNVLGNGPNQKMESALAKLWREQMADKYPGLQKELTNKEHGQLKLLRTKLGQGAAAVVQFAFEEWLKVVETANSDHGVTGPLKPHIGFLLAHYDVVVNMMLQAEKWQQEKVEVQKVFAAQAQSSPAADQPTNAEQGPVPVIDEALMATLTEAAKHAHDW